MKLLLPFLAAFTLITSTSCKQKEDIPGTYDIVTVGNNDYTAYALTLVIEMGAVNRISGHSGCNQYFGDFKNPEGNKVAIGPLASTKMYCLKGNDIEREYMNQLSKVTAVNPTKTGLELMDNAGTILITALKK